MFDKFSQALALVREAFEDAQAGAGGLAPADLVSEVDGAQQVINAASAVQALRVAQYATRGSGGCWAALMRTGCVSRLPGSAWTGLCRPTLPTFRV